MEISAPAPVIGEKILQLIREQQYMSQIIILKDEQNAHLTQRVVHYNMKFEASSSEISDAHTREDAPVHESKAARRALTANRQAYGAEKIALEKELTRERRSIESMRADSKRQQKLLAAVTA